MQPENSVIISIAMINNNKSNTIAGGHECEIRMKIIDVAWIGHFSLTRHSGCRKFKLTATSMLQLKKPRLSGYNQMLK